MVNESFIDTDQCIEATVKPSAGYENVTLETDLWGPKPQPATTHSFP